MIKYFIITVDTEGDNLWRYKQGDEIGVKNAEYLSRFQFLCEKYGFKPVYLTNYEMASSNVFIKNAKEWLTMENCEVGVHLHAWNNPPLCNLQGPYNGNSYLIEYPEDIMRSKFKVIYDLIVTNFGINPVSHRAGRWAMDDRYFNILKEYGILVDCSYTPGVNWSKTKGISMGGSDYSKIKNKVSIINGILEVPVTIHKFRCWPKGTLMHKVKSLLIGDNVWLRPASSTVSNMRKIIDIVYKQNQVDFVEFMIHSSEVMPDGSPYFQTEASIEKEFSDMEKVFSYAREKGFVGCTLKEYYNDHS